MASQVVAGDPVIPPPDASMLFQEGKRAFAEGLPQIAIHKFQRCLAANPPAEIRRAAVLTIAQALLSTADGAAALDLLNREFPPDRPPDPTAIYLRAQALAGLGRWEEALADYNKTGQLSADLKRISILGRIEALVALHRNGEALQFCKSLSTKSRVGDRARLRGAEIALDAGQLKDAALLLIDKHPVPGARPPVNEPGLDNERAYLMGRLRLAQKQTALAEKLFAAAANHPEGLSERLLANHFWGWTQACLEQGKLAEAEDVLENFVGTYPRTSYLKATLAFLQKLYDRNPQLPNLADLRHWAADTSEPSRQIPALFMLAHVEKSLGHPESAEKAFETFVEIYPSHALRIRATLDLATLQLSENHLSEAHRSLDQARSLLATPGSDTGEARSEIDMLDARLNLAGNDSAKAAALFESIAGRAGLTHAQVEAAAFNAVLSWLRTSDTDRFATTERAFLERFPQSLFGRELALEEGLARAARTPQTDRNGRQRAAAALRRFLRENSTHPRAPEARIALAELAFERPHPNLTAAWHELDSGGMLRVDNPAKPASNPATGPDLSHAGERDALPENDRATYLAIWLADTPGPTRDSKRAITLAKRFLDSRGDSSLAPEVRMKLCEIYFREEDYSDAQTQLELLVEKSPEPPLVESALYLAGLSASRSMSATGVDNAIVLFERAARLDGPFKLPARLRQADLQKRLGNLPDALTLYKEVLTATAADSELADADLESRCSALAGQGETLLIQGAKDPKAYREASEIFEQLAHGTAKASFLWRRQALTQKGTALEKSGDFAAALLAYNDAIDLEPPETGNREPEWTWFYRAGNSAARLLETQSQWAAAIAIYKKLAAVDGPLKSEYENKLSRRRLEHFIWED